MSTSLLQFIDEYLAETGLSGHRFSKLAAHSMLYERLKKGGRVWPETEVKIRAYIMSQRQNPSPRQRRRSTQQHAQV